MLTIILISLKYFESIVVVILFNFKTDLKIYVEITRCPLQTYMYLLDKKSQSTVWIEWNEICYLNIFYYKCLNTFMNQRI